MTDTVNYNPLNESEIESAGFVDAASDLAPVTEDIGDRSGAFAMQMASAYLRPSGGDDSDAMVKALTNFAPFVSPVVMLGPGTFKWTNQVPAFAPDMPAKVIGSGREQTVIQLSSGAPSVFDLGKVNDGDVFSNIEISDFSVDGNNVGGRRHVLFGNYINGNLTSRIGVTGLRIDRIHMYNVPSAPSTGNYNTATLHRLCIHIAGSDSVASGTQINLTDIVIRDVRMEGGNEGIFIGGSGISTDGLNVYLDRVYIHDCWHSTMAEPQQFFGSANFQIGSRAWGDDAGVFNCYGFGSGDVGIEVDSLNNVYCWNNTMVDPWNVPFYFTNFHTPSRGSGQQITWDHCTGVFTSGVAALNNARGFGIVESLSIPLGQVNILDGEVLDSAPSCATSAFLGRAVYCVPNQLDRLVIRGFRVSSAGLVYNSASNQAYSHFYISVNNSNLPEYQLIMRDIECSMAYTQASTGVISYDAVFIAGGTTNGGGCRFLIDDLRWSAAGTTVSANSLRGIELNSGQNIGGRIKGFRCLSVTGDTGPRGILIRGTGQPLVLTRVTVEDCDFSGLQAGGAEILFTDATNKPFVEALRNAYKTAPAPTTLTGLVTATGKQLATGWAKTMASFTQGSGTSITAIDYSTDGGAHYTNFLTQASGALPTGFSQALGPLPSSALLKVTFTGTQPTINLAPVDP